MKFIAFLFPQICQKKLSGGDENIPPSPGRIGLNILYVPHNTRKIQVAYKSKQNLTCGKQVILLMITDGEKWHYLKIYQDYLEE